MKMKAKNRKLRPKSSTEAKRKKRQRGRMRLKTRKLEVQVAEHRPKKREARLSKQQNGGQGLEQCWGSGSACFWASRIWIRIH
jgi:hypothetical protein